MKKESKKYTQDDYFNDEFPKEKPKQHVELINDNIDEFDKAIKLFKQETLEEAAKNYVDYCSCNISEDEDLADADKRGFIYGAKWQMERSYSEEEVFAMLLIKHDGLTPEYVLEQFKKK